MTSALLIGTGALLAVGALRFLFRRAFGSVRTISTGEPTPSQARIAVDGKKADTDIDAHAEREKTEVDDASGDPLRDGFLARMLRKPKR